MNQLTIRGHDVAVPADWSDITRNDLCLLGRLFPLVPTHRTSMALLIGLIRKRGNMAVKWALFQNMNLGERLYRKLGYNPFLERISLTLEKLDQFSWVYKENKLHQSRFPSIRFWFWEFYGPTDKLYDVTVNEFFYADRFYLAYMKDQEDKMLNLLVAALWRPADGSGKRRAFDENEFDSHLPIIRRMPRHLKHALLINYIGMRDAVVTSKPGRRVFTSSEKTTARKEGWGHVILRLSGNKFGDHDKTKTALFWDVLRELEMQKNDAAEMKRNMPKKRKR